jgi:hypothetical protein
MNFYPALTCKNESCSHQIALPDATPSGSNPSQIPWPPGAKQRNFLCLAYKHVFSYSAEDCHWFPVLPQKDQTDRTNLAVHLMWLECGGEPPGEQIPVNTVAPEGSPIPSSLGLMGPLYMSRIVCPVCSYVNNGWRDARKGHRGYVEDERG